MSTDHVGGVVRLAECPPPGADDAQPALMLWSFDEPAGAEQTRTAVLRTHDLVDVSQMARCAGWTLPVAITATAWLRRTPRVTSCTAGCLSDRRRFEQALWSLCRLLRATAPTGPMPWTGEPLQLRISGWPPLHLSGTTFGGTDTALLDLDPAS